MLVPAEIREAVRDLESMHKARIEVYEGEPPSGAARASDNIYYLEAATS